MKHFRLENSLELIKDHFMLVEDITEVTKIHNTIGERISNLDTSCLEDSYGDMLAHLSYMQTQIKNLIVKHHKKF